MRSGMLATWLRTVSTAAASCHGSHEVLGSPLASLGGLMQHTRSFAGFSRIAEHEKGKTKFTGYYAGGFSINNVQVPGSVIAQSDMFLLWKPRTLEEITVESLIFLDIITPAPEVLVLGCGLASAPLPRHIAEYLQRKGIKVEVLDSRNACGYFNVLNDEGRMVVGALLAPDSTVPLAQVLPEQQEKLHERGFTR